MENSDLRHCEHCDGSGESGLPGYDKCFSCGGTGLFKDQDPDRVECDDCEGGGEGHYEGTICSKCEGCGWHFKEEDSNEDDEFEEE